MKQFIEDQIEHIKRNKDVLLYLGIFAVIAAVTGYGIGYHQQTQKIPDRQVVSNAAYDSFNYSMRDIEQGNWEAAKKHIESGNSFISVLYQTGQKKWEEVWLSNAVLCLERENKEQCKNSVKTTMQALEKQANLTKS